MLSLSKIIKNASSHGKTELNRIEYLDGWRGMAISSVLIAHFLSIEAIDFGRLGVDIFFVLSGLLMSKILFVKRVPLKIFYKRRISRVFPLFLVFLSGLYLYAYLFRLPEYENYFYSLFFIRSYFPVSPNIFNTGIPVGHIWSLNVEEHCYVLLSVIAAFKIFKGKEYMPLLILGVSAIFLHYLYVQYPDIATKNYRMKTEIVASHLLISAGYFLIKDNFTRYVSPWMPVFTFVVAVSCYSVFVQSDLQWFISPFLLAFTVNHLELIPNFFKVILSNRLLQLLGMWSYSIYIWQQPFYYYYSGKFGESFSFVGVIFIFVIVLIGMASFYYLENPIRRYLNNKW